MLNILLSNAWDINRSNGFINWFYSPEFVFGIAKYAICILIGIFTLNKKEEPIINQDGFDNKIVSAAWVEYYKNLLK